MPTIGIKMYETPEQTLKILIRQLNLLFSTLDSDNIPALLTLGHAANIGVNDTGGYFTSTSLEGVLQEIGSRLSTHGI